MTPVAAAAGRPARASFRARFLASPSGSLSALVILALALCAILGPALARHDPDLQMRAATLQPPAWISGDWSLPLGTDDLGRDIWSRLLAGARLSLASGALVVTLSASAGTLIGLLAGFAGGVVDFAIMRLVDVLLAVPVLLLGIAIVAALGPGISTAIIAITIIQVPPFVRLTRALVRSEMGRDYVAAARVAGEGPWRLMLATILPNCLAPLIVQATLAFSGAILELAALGFLGMGAQPPAAEWGTMLSDALQFVQSAWWVVTFPGLAIFVTVLAFNLAGDTLRDALDPRLARDL